MHSTCEYRWRKPGASDQNVNRRRDEVYRAAYAAKGYIERKELTMVANGSFKMVFDGDASGLAVVVQSEDLGDGGLLITVRLEDL